MATVTLINAKSYNSGVGDTLLGSAMRQGIVLEHSCRNGRCGACKAKLICGETEVTQEEQGLTDEQKAKGFILTCCRAALSDLSLGVEDLGFLSSINCKILPCRIDSIEKKARDIIYVVLRLPSGLFFDYVPGQYINIIGRDGVRRSYSLASAPRDDGRLELQIRFVENGLMSHYWFFQARKNDLLRLEGPLGTFALRNIDVRNLVFLATGTGIAPVKAILEQLNRNPSFFAGKSIYVYWGGRFPEDIYWNPQFENIALSFVPVLSRAGEGWLGRRGYVHQALLEDRIDLASSVVYACGSETMIHTARSELMLKGLPEKFFYSDAFVSSN